MKFLLSRVAAVVAAVLVVSGSTQAAWVTVGHATTGTNIQAPNDQANVNYAVFQQTTKGAGGDLATYLATNTNLQTALLNSLGAAGLTKLENDTFVYLYQVTAPKNNIQDFYVANPSSANVTGWANGFTFNQNGANVTSGQLSDSPGTGGTLNGAGGAKLTFTSNSNPKAVNVVNVAVTNFHGDSVPDANKFTFKGDGVLVKDKQNVIGFSSLIVLGSDYGPALGRIQTGDGGANDGLAPVPTPEPTTIALMGLALPLLGYGYSRRLKVPGRAPAQA